MTAMSSIDSATCGEQMSLTSMPLWPYLRNLNGDGKRGAGLPLGAQVAAGQRLGRRTLASAGLGSNVSTCDGPPFMKRWMTCLALAGKCGDARQQRIRRRGRRVCAPSHQVAQRQRAEAHAAALQQLAAGEGQMFEVEWCGMVDVVISWSCRGRSLI